MGTPTATHVETLTDDGTLTQYTSTASLAPNAGDLCVVYWIGRDSALGSPSGIINGGTLDLTWAAVNVTGTINVDFGNNDGRVGIFAAIADASPGSGTVTIDWSAEDALNSAGWGIVRCTPSQGAWASVADAIPQAVGAGDPTVNSSPITVTLAALGSAESLILGFMSTCCSGGATANIATPGAQFSSLGSDNTATGPGTSVLTQEGVGQTTVDATYSDTDAGWIAIAVEIADPASTAFTSRLGLLGVG